jgi:signal transduction histidine kinase
MSHLPDDANRKAVMRILLVGFGMVLIILGVASLVALREKQIRRDAVFAMKNHLVHAQLLHEIQVQEDILTQVLHQLASRPGSEKIKEKYDELLQADQTLQQLADQAASNLQTDQWRQLADASRRFTEIAQIDIRQQNEERIARIDEMFSQHEIVVKIIHNLIQQHIQNWVSMDERMRVELDELGTRSTIMLTACFLLAIVFAASTLLIARKSIERMQWQRDELNRVSWHMLQTQEDTARRFSHELHDELGQSLAAVRANLVHSAPMSEDQRNDCLHLVDESIANVRELSQLLRPVILDDFGLEAGLRWLLDRFGQRSRIDVTFASNLDVPLLPGVETHLFRIAQEALTNIARHSQASSVHCKLWLDQAWLQLMIEDDGIGLTPNASEQSSSLGLIGMRARARECGGSLELENVVPSGLRIKILLPRARVTVP